MRWTTIDMSTPVHRHSCWSCNPECPTSQTKLGPEPSARSRALSRRLLELTRCASGDRGRDESREQRNMGMGCPRIRERAPQDPRVEKGVPQDPRCENGVAQDPRVEKGVPQDPRCEKGIAQDPSTGRLRIRGSKGGRQRSEAAKRGRPGSEARLPVEGEHFI